jgi:hypothetical protein
MNSSGDGGGVLLVGADPADEEEVESFCCEEILFSFKFFSEFLIND